MKKYILLISFSISTITYYSYASELQDISIPSSNHDLDHYLHNSSLDQYTLTLYGSHREILCYAYSCFLLNELAGEMILEEFGYLGTEYIQLAESDEDTESVGDSPDINNLNGFDEPEQLPPRLYMPHPQWPPEGGGGGYDLEREPYLHQYEKLVNKEGGINKT